MGDLRHLQNEDYNMLPQFDGVKMTQDLKHKELKQGRHPIKS